MSFFELMFYFLILLSLHLAALIVFAFARGKRRTPSFAQLLNGAEALLIALMAASRH